MKKAMLAVAFVLVSTCALLAASPNPPTMRVDFYHTGNATSQNFSLDRVVIEPLPWPGSMSENSRIDNTNLGKYMFEVRDRAKNELLFSRGFSSIFGEWETTEEAKAMNRTFSESLRFPRFEQPLRIVLKQRDSENNWKQVWTADINPKDMFVGTSKPASAGPLITIEKNGDSTEKVDFLILGDGYTAAQRTKCEADAHRLTRILFSTSPYKEREKDFNVWALCPASAESGISRPSTGIHKRSPIGATYDAFGSERYILTFENRAMRDLASQELTSSSKSSRTPRHTAEVEFSACTVPSPPTATGRLTSSSTSSDTISPVSPTSTTRRTSLTCLLLNEPNPGSRT